MANITKAPPVDLSLNSFAEQCKKFEISLDSLRAEMFFYKRLLKLKEPKRKGFQEHRNKLKKIESLSSIRLTRLIHDFADFNENFSTYSQTQKNIFSWDYQKEYTTLSRRLNLLQKDFQEFKESSYAHLISLYLEHETVKFI